MDDHEKWMIMHDDVEVVEMRTLCELGETHDDAQKMGHVPQETKDVHRLPILVCVYELLARIL